MFFPRIFPWLVREVEVVHTRKGLKSFIIHDCKTRPDISGRVWKVLAKCSVVANHIYCFCKMNYWCVVKWAHSIVLQIACTSESLTMLAEWFPIMTQAHSLCSNPWQLVKNCHKQRQTVSQEYFVSRILARSVSNILKTPFFTTVLKSSRVSLYMTWRHLVPYSNGLT